MNTIPVSAYNRSANLSTADLKREEMQNPPMKSLSDFKKEVKALGYKVKTTGSTSFASGNYHRHLQILDQEGNFIVGSGANVYYAPTVEKHKKIFDLMRENKGRIFDTSYDPPQKLLW
jgi:hypothetical protein